MKKSSALGLGLVGLVGLAGVVACGGSSEILSGDLGGALASSNDAASLRDGGVAPPVGTPTSPPPRDAGPQSLRDARPASILDLTGRWRASSEDPISVELEQGGVVLGGRACGVMMVVTPGQSLLEPGNPNCTTFMDGRVEGRRVQFRFTLSYPYPGISPIDYRVDAQISADGRSFEGDLEEYDHGTKRVTVHKVTWTPEPPAGTPTSPPRDGGAPSLRDAGAAAAFDLTGPWRAWHEDPISAQFEQRGSVLGGRVCGVNLAAPSLRTLTPDNENCTTFMDARIDGRRVQFRFTLPYPDRGKTEPADYRVDVQLSADGSTLVGDLHTANGITTRVLKVNWTRE